MIDLPRQSGGSVPTPRSLHTALPMPEYWSNTGFRSEMTALGPLERLDARDRPVERDARRPDRARAGVDHDGGPVRTAARADGSAADGIGSRRWRPPRVRRQPGRRRATTSPIALAATAAATSGPPTAPGATDGAGRPAGSSLQRSVELVAGGERGQEHLDARGGDLGDPVVALTGGGRPGRGPARRHRSPRGGGTRSWRRGCGPPARPTCPG